MGISLEVDILTAFCVSLCTYGDGMVWYGMVLVSQNSHQVPNELKESPHMVRSE